MKYMIRFILFITIFQYSTIARAVLPIENIGARSARLDALQLNVSIEDETNVIGLQKYGGNPAGILLDEEKSRLVPVFEYTNSKQKSDPVIKFDNYLPGMFGVFKDDLQAIQFQVNGQVRKRNRLGENTEQGLADVKYNRKFGKLLGAVGINYLKETQEFDASGSGTNRSDPISYVVGLGFSNPLQEGKFDLGAHYSRTSTKAELPSANPTGADQDSIGAQAIYGLAHVLNLGISYRYDGYKEETLNNGNVSKSRTYDYGMRAFINPEGSSLRFGLSGSFVEYVDNLNDSETINTTVGTSYLTRSNNLLGLEYRYLNNQNRNPSPIPLVKQNGHTVTVGAEHHLVTNLVGRASYLYSQLNSNLKNQKTNSVGVGLGYLVGAAGKIDLSYTNAELDYGSETITEKLNLMGTFYF